MTIQAELTELAMHYEGSVALVPGAKYSLVFISDPNVNERWDFETVARLVREIAPDIQTAVFDDQAIDWRGVPADFNRPACTFSPGPLRRFRPFRGTVFQGLPLRKSQEYAALEGAGLPVPRWAIVTPTATPDLSDFGSYVVMKPDRGGRGANVKIVRTSRVHWRAPRTDFARALAGEKCDWIVQKFVYTGPYPISYRVATLFGQPIWSWKAEADRARRPVAHRNDFRSGGVSIVSSGKGSVFSLADDSEILELARRAHRAFPAVPLIGVDIVRDVETGRLFVIEVNAVGLTWHLTSPLGRKIQQDFGFDLDAQFGARRRAAALLVEQVRHHAR